MKQVDINESTKPLQTLSETLDYLCNVLSDDIKDQIRRMPREEAERLRFIPGTQVHNTLGLNGENRNLLANCLAVDADDASKTILFSLWMVLKDGTTRPPTLTH